MSTSIRTPHFSKLPPFARYALPLTLACLLLGACGALPKPHAPPLEFVLSDATPTQAAPIARPNKQQAQPTLLVETPRASAGLDSRAMHYTRRAYAQEAFASHEWADTPAKMMAPLMVQALQRSAAFQAVVLTPTTATGALRLESTLLELEQDFTLAPSQVHLRLRVQLIANASRVVLGERDIEVSVVAQSEDPYAGAVAANQALHQALLQLTEFCANLAVAKD